MITDANLQVSDAQTLKVTAATIPSTNAIDLASTEVISPEIGVGKPLFAVVSFPEALNLLTSIQIEIVVDDDFGLATTPVVIGSTDVLTLAQVLAMGNNPIVIAINPNPELTNPEGTLFQYLGVRYITAGTTPTTGTVSCDFVEAIQGPIHHYPSKLTIA